MTRAHGLLVGIALTACGAPRASDPLRVSDSELGAATRPSAPQVAPIPRLQGPTRPQTVATLEVDVANLPVLTSVRADHLPEPVRQGAVFDARLNFSGLEGIDLEVGTDRWLAYRGGRAAGEKPFQNVPRSAFAAWRGHMAKGSEGRLHFLCFEGSYDGERAELSAAYEVLAEPIVPGVVWAFRSGRTDFAAPPPVLDAKGQPLMSPEPCNGADRVEFVGPSPMWMVGPSRDPRDAIGYQCARGGCPFSRVALPILPGQVTSALIVSDDPKQRGQFDGVPPTSNIFSYTFELDSTGDGPAAGRIFVGAEATAAANVVPTSLRFGR